MQLFMRMLLLFISYDKHIHWVYPNIVNSVNSNLWIPWMRSSDLILENLEVLVESSLAPTRHSCEHSCL